MRLADLKIRSSWYTLAGVIYEGHQPKVPPRAPATKRAYLCGACGGPGHNIKSCRANLRA